MDWKIHAINIRIFGISKKSSNANKGVMIGIIACCAILAVTAIVFGVILSLAAAGGAIFLLNHSKNKVKMDMYKKIGSSRWGVNFK